MPVYISGMIQKVRISDELKHELHDEVIRTRIPGGAYRVRSAWPGVQLYYPPIKYLPQLERYETEHEATERLQKYARSSQAHSVIFDLEDGCRQKAMSRSFLKAVLPGIRASIPGRVVIRINPLYTAENSLDMRLIENIFPHIDDVMLAKAGETNGVAELDELEAFLSRLSPQLKIQPIIEHPKSLKIAGGILAHRSVEHAVFGIHDFSRAMHIQITAENWQNELYPYMCSLSTEARLAGKGLIGGVETLLMDTEPPEIPLIPEWLTGRAEANARIIFDHARREANMGFTGKQVIHPNHIRLIRYAFQPANENIHRSLRILEAAVRANAFLGGAIRFENEMMDPPMFAKALQVILRSIMLGNEEKNLAEICSGIIESLPEDKVHEIWPFPVN